jgi:hypothetical protein
MIYLSAIFQSPIFEFRLAINNQILTNAKETFLKDFQLPKYQRQLSQLSHRMKREEWVNLRRRALFQPYHQPSWHNDGEDQSIADNGILGLALQNIIQHIRSSYIGKELLRKNNDRFGKEMRFMKQDRMALLQAQHLHRQKSHPYNYSECWAFCRLAGDEIASTLALRTIQYIFNYVNAPGCRCNHSPCTPNLLATFWLPSQLLLFDFCFFCFQTPCSTR